MKFRVQVGRQRIHQGMIVKTGTYDVGSGGGDLGCMGRIHSCCAGAKGKFKDGPMLRLWFGSSRVDAEGQPSTRSRMGDFKQDEGV